MRAWAVAREQGGGESALARVNYRLATSLLKEGRIRDNGLASIVIVTYKQQSCVIKGFLLGVQMYS